MPNSATEPEFAYIERNIRTMSAIGGVYDLLTDLIVQDHGEVLRKGGFAVDLYWERRSSGSTPEQAYWTWREEMKHIGPATRLNVKLLNDDATFPTRGHADDAGIDLYTSVDIWINPGESVDVATAVAVEFPAQTWGMLVGRSSTLRKHNLLVNTGIIDHGYRGELYINVHNLGERAFSVHKGMRLGQLIPMSNIGPMLALHQVDELAPHERGENGFGSTGV